MKHLLLIEDNKEVSENTAEILELNGYKVSTAFDGKEGVRKAQQLDPDLILCDIMMPEMDGYGVAYTLQQSDETNGIPLIFLSAKVEKADIRKGMELGADDYLTKPFTSLELLTAIETRLKKPNKNRNTDSITSFLNYQEGELIKRVKLLIDEHGILPKRFKKKEIIYTESARPYQLFYVNSGLVKICKSVRGGREIISQYLSEGAFLGAEELMLDKPFHNYAVAAEDAVLYPISKETWMDLIRKNSSLHLNIHAYLLNQRNHLEQKLAFCAFKSVKKRLAVALLELDYLYSKYLNESTIKTSREDLANYVGVSPETAIRTLSDFKSKGFISIISGKIEVTDKEGLKGIRN